LQSSSKSSLIFSVCSLSNNDFNDLDILVNPLSLPDGGATFVKSLSLSNLSSDYGINFSGEIISPSD